MEGEEQASFSGFSSMPSAVKTPEGPRFLCEYPGCDQSFSRRYNLTRHQAIHTDKPKEFKCSHCPSAFDRAYDLKVHQRTHEGDKPYTCTFCGRSFARSSSWRAHERLHQPEQTTASAVPMFPVWHDGHIDFVAHRHLYHFNDNGTVEEHMFGADLPAPTQVPVLEEGEHEEEGGHSHADHARDSQTHYHVEDKAVYTTCSRCHEQQSSTHPHNHDEAMPLAAIVSPLELLSAAATHNGGAHSPPPTAEATSGMLGLCHTRHHVHGEGCGHPSVPHDGHMDYLVNDQLHHAHSGHCHIHGVVSFVVIPNVDAAIEQFFA